MKKQWLLIAAVLILLLSGCGNGNEQETSSSDHSSGSHEEMDHSGSGEVPPELKSAANPTYKVGSQAMVQTDHMSGMKGATGTIVGAYDTIVYAVTYTPVTGGEQVPNHKWVIHEELQAAQAESYNPGDEVVLEADHMKGMKGAKATIDSAERTTVYMIDYTPTNGGPKVTNHKWVTEDELTAK
ncbi:YdhK family protein [Paenibacillus sp. YPG26]|uniref:YdhK family protein n=1 Tax=Paenibacillus sp. YPG26 TaxID=2878915 RepID=UPI002041822B|nr:YdhK family protein [Paenibacillus sp. YPG26]USB31741.1 YdhK family protein [Paenibacillus sp. YPG26]